MNELNVAIAGAGLGGLCLAQSLRKAGVHVNLFERDESAWDRPQGYRLHIDGDGVDALAAALPESLFRLFEQTSMKPVPSTTIVDTDFNVLRRVMSEGGEDGDGKGGPDSAHFNVNRVTLRQILLAGLDDALHFGEKLIRYDGDDDGVTAYFESGREMRCDLLVGADGIRSAVRRQRFPEADTQDTGVRAVYGKLSIEAARELLPRQALEDVFTVAVDDRKIFFGIGPVEFPTRPDVASDLWAPEAKLFGQDDYVVCIVGGRLELFGHDDETIKRLDSKGLQDLTQKMIAGWPERARAVLSAADPDSSFFVEMFTSVPMTLPPPTNVTLLGDAIHAMTPTLGRGANCAMRDGAALGEQLKRVSAGETSLADALKTYEDAMSSYGFDVVRHSAAMGQRLMGQNPLPA